MNIMLTWQYRKPPPYPYDFYLQLVDEDGGEIGAIVPEAGEFVAHYEGWYTGEPEVAKVPTEEWAMKWIEGMALLAVPEDVEVEIYEV